MMGCKTRRLAPARVVALEELVPADDFYRHLERMVDLALVRDLVRETYAAAGRAAAHLAAVCRRPSRCAAWVHGTESA
jgi:hypothetical protein